MGKDLSKGFWEWELDQEWSKRELQVSFFQLWAIGLVHYELENKSLHWDALSIEKNNRYSLHQFLFVGDMTVSGCIMKPKSPQS